MIDAGLLHGRTSVLVEISLHRHSADAMRRFEQAMQDCDRVTDCYATGGGVDYVLKIMCDDIDQYQRLIDRWLEQDLGIERYYTYIVTKTIKQQPLMPAGQK
ncbi:Lrp/AsnC ligand binding domain-containing protein [Oceanimonas sp. NS1]|nr:Lrp/AsnC ligand binding domain-containing protein [Oceanimonas sp. NS1]